MSLPEVIFLDSRNSHNEKSIPKGITALTHLGYGALDLTDVEHGEETSVLQVYEQGEHKKPYPMMPGQTVHWEDPTEQPVIVKYPSSSGRAMIAVGRGSFVTHPQDGELEDGGLVIPGGLSKGFDGRAVTLWSMQDWDTLDPAAPWGKQFVLSPPYGLAVGTAPSVDLEGDLHIWRSALPCARNISLGVRAYFQSGTGNIAIQAYQAPWLVSGKWPTAFVTATTAGPTSGVWAIQTSAALHSRTVLIVVSSTVVGVDPHVDFFAKVW